jgi:opacity protein-like surface antigen
MRSIYAARIALVQSGQDAYVAEGWMIYLTGGGANADVKIIATEPAAGIATESKLRWGWTAGVGVEAARIHSFR